MRKIYQWLRGEGPLWRIGVAIGGTLALALAIAAVATVVGAQVLDIHGTRTEPLSAATLYDLLKIAFAFAAGIGGVIALVTAYRRQRVAEFAHQLADRAEDRAARDSQQERELAATRLFNERFATAAGQLGDDKPAVRLAGVYAMAGLADDWPDQRQTCVDVLCAYLRMPYEPDPGDEAPPAARQAFRALREVRHTVIRVITAHLQPDHRRAATARDWRGLNLDFTGTIFDGGTFDGAEFSGGEVTFDGAEFSGGLVTFSHAKFSDGRADFYGAKFSGGDVYFSHAKFSGGMVNFGRAEFSGGEVRFDYAEFSRGSVNFTAAQFSGSEVDFDGTQFSGGEVRFDYAEFSGGEVNFSSADIFGGTAFSGSEVNFNRSEFSGGEVNFTAAEFSGGMVNFVRAEFSAGSVDFTAAQFSGGSVNFNTAKFCGGEVDFSRAAFSGGKVTFERVANWRTPPQFPAWTSPPPEVTLPSSR